MKLYHATTQKKANVLSLPMGMLKCTLTGWMLRQFYLFEF